LFKTGFKPVFGFTDLNKNILLYKANDFMNYVLLTVIISSLISVLSLAIIMMLQIGPFYQPFLLILMQLSM